MGIKTRCRERRKRIVAHKAKDHEDARLWDLEYWQSKTPQERLSALVALHEDYRKIQAARKKRKRP